MKPVTDPNLLQALEGPAGKARDAALAPVTDPDVLASLGGNDTPEPMSSTEAAARAFGHHLTFGLGDPLIGRVFDQSSEEGRAKYEQAAAEHPYIDFASGAAAMIPQTMALGPLAAAGRGVQVAAGAPKIAELGAAAARGLGRVAETFVPNTGAQTAAQTARTAAKVGAAYSGAETLGSGVTDPNKSWQDIAKDTAVATGTGAVGGAGLGLGFHGVSRLGGALANRLFPSLREALTEVNAPGAQGIRDVGKMARYDKADIAGLLDKLTPKPPPGSSMTPEAAVTISNRLEAGETPAQIAVNSVFSPAEIGHVAQQHAAIASKYGNLNFIEALKMGDMKQNARGEWLPEIKTTVNLDKQAQRAANIEGEGRNEAATAFAARKQGLSEQARNDVDSAFGGDDATRAAAQTALEKQKGILDAGYDKIRKKGQIIEVPNFGGIENAPVFQKALQYAGVSDLVRKTGSTEGPGLHIWKPSDGTMATEGQQSLTPTNLLDIHHALVMQARNAVGGDPVEAATATHLKNWFSQYVDGVFKKHEGLRQDYKAYKDVLEASDKASSLGINTSNPAAKQAEAWFVKQQNAVAKEIPDLQKEIARQQKLLDDTTAKYGNSSLTSAQKGTMTRAQKRLDDAQNRLDLRQMQFGEFRRAWGDGIVSQIERSADPNVAIRNLLSPTGQRRIQVILGDEKGKEFIQALDNKRMQTGWGNTLYGGSDTAFKMKGFEPSEALGRLVMSLAHFRPTEALRASHELVSQAYRQRGADQVNRIYSQQGVEPVRGIANSLVKQQALRSTADPFLRNPALRAIGPIGAEANSGLSGQTPYQRKFDDEGNPLPRAEGGKVGGALRLAWKYKR